MSEVSERYDRVASDFDKVLAGVSDQWGSPSPCEGWSARDVVRHIVDVHRMMLARLDGSEPQLLADEDDPAAAWSSVRDEVVDRVSDPAQAATVVGGAFGEQPWEQLVGRVLCADTLLHTWDLSRATGQQVALDDETARSALEWMTPLDDAMRRPGGFGPKIDAPEGADDLTKLVAFSGRHP